MDINILSFIVLFVLNRNCVLQSLIFHTADSVGVLNPTTHK